ncbi:hypothetical protein IAG41_20785 [Sphingomonas sp. JC676]|uniref:hypothetical protein n=1 Tax=Sphingomonas sp. JC676 TaxID=2768065 RepID=UPI0016582751|nr:hypothetical protein [Sphingomonas sp. JC676]MBC9034835.1 hypothetical protein [Sphingomonas sp. JC676]
MVASTAFGWISGLVACGDTHGAGPIIAFELARTPDAVRALFGAEPCLGTYAQAQRDGLWLDLLGFIPAYSAFLALGAFALRGQASRLALVTAAIVLLAGLLDEAEGLVMFRILAALPGTPELLQALFWTVRPKFALLGLGEILLALMLWRGPLLGKVAAGPLLAGGLVSIGFLLANPHSPTMMKAHSYAWMALLLVALVASVRPALVARVQPR